MSFQTFVYILSRRWWVILVTTALAITGALTYAQHQQRIYQAMATTLAHPVSGAVGGDPTSKASLLSYGNLADTFAGMAESRTYLYEVGKELGMPSATLHQYTVKAQTRSTQELLQVSVDGPNA